MSQQAYWDRAAETKSFTHPLPLSWLETYCPKDAALLDFGCGYGRTCGELLAAGYTRVTGADFSSRMIARARVEAPGCRYLCPGEGPLPFEDACFDGVLLLAVLTCIPADAAQQALMDELFRILKPGGIVCVSDYPLQTDERNIARYERYTDRYDGYGVFELDEGVVLRHYDDNRFERLFEKFSVLDRRELDLVTMNGHAARIRQFLLRRGEGQGGI